MGVRFLPDRRRFPKGPSSVASDADLWAAAVVANAGTVSAGRKTIVETFIAAEKAAGSWALTDDYFPLWGENVPQALTSLKQRRLAVPVSAPNFTGDRGYLFNGTTNYINTGFNLSTHAVAMTGNNCRLAVYERTELASSIAASAGGNATGNAMMQIISRSGSSLMLNRLNVNAAQAFTGAATSLGYSAVSRNGDVVASLKAYKNGVALVQTGAAPSTFAAILPAQPLYIGAQNGNGTAANFRATSNGFTCVGAALSDAQELDQRTNVQAWATAIGANV